MWDAGIPASWATPKALRHAFGVSGVADAGVPLNMMQKRLGHTSTETTAIFADAVGKEKRAILQSTWR